MTLDLDEREDEYGTAISAGAAFDTRKLWKEDMAYMGADCDKVGSGDRSQYDRGRGIYHDVYGG